METAAPPDTVRFTTVRSRSASGSVLVSWTGLADCVEAHVVRNRSDAAASQTAGAPSDRGAALWWLTAGRLATSGLPAPVGRGFLVWPASPAPAAAPVGRGFLVWPASPAPAAAPVERGFLVWPASPAPAVEETVARGHPALSCFLIVSLEPLGQPAAQKTTSTPTARGTMSSVPAADSKRYGTRRNKRRVECRRTGVLKKEGSRLLVGTARPICVVDADGSGADPGNHHIDLSADQRMATVS